MLLELLLIDVDVLQALGALLRILLDVPLALLLLLLLVLVRFFQLGFGHLGKLFLEVLLSLLVHEQLALVLVVVLLYFLDLL